MALVLVSVVHLIFLQLQLKLMKISTFRLTVVFVFVNKTSLLDGTYRGKATQ